MKEKIELPLSSKSTGIEEQKTPVVLIKGIPEGAVLTNFNIDILNNKVIGVWLKKRYNNEGTEIQSEEFYTEIKDVGEVGEVTVDPITREPDMATYRKEKDENLILTNYFKQLGDIILTPMLSKISADNGYVKTE